MGLVKLVLALFGIELRQAAKKAVASALDDTQPIPLTMRDVSRQQEQIRRATAHGSGEHRIERKTIVPPDPEDPWPGRD